MRPIPADFPARGVPTDVPDVVLTGHDPSERQRRVPAAPRDRAERRARDGRNNDHREEAFDAEAMKFENRADPYPFFDELRKTPVVV